MRVSTLTVILFSSLLSLGYSCNVASWGYGSYGSSSYYDDYNPGPQVGFGFSPGFFGYTGGFGLGSLGLLLAMLFTRHPHPPPRVVHHHHHHYYKEKPGGGFDYQYKNEGPKWEQDPRRNPSSNPDQGGPKNNGPFSNFFKNMFYRR